MPKPEVMPVVTDIVVYTSYGTPGGEYTSLPRFAAVAAVPKDDPDGALDLVVLNPTGQFFNQGTKYSPTPSPGCWSPKPASIAPDMAELIKALVAQQVQEALKAQVPARPYIPPFAPVLGMKMSNWKFAGDLKAFTRVQGTAGLRVDKDGGGNTSLVVTLRKGDPLDSGGKRSEGLLSSDNGAPWLITPGALTELKQRIYIPPNFKSAPQWQIWGFQFHHKGAGGPPPYSLEGHGEELRIRRVPSLFDAKGLGKGGVLWSVPSIPRGQYLEFVHRNQWGLTDTTAWNEVYLNGQNIVPRQYGQNMLDEYCVLKQGGYRDDSIAFDQEIWLSGLEFNIQKAA